MREKEIIVSLTTIPSRKNSLLKTIGSILGQSYEFDKFVINIDNNLSEEDYLFYGSITGLDKRIEVNLCDAKWRSCNKLLPTITKYQNDVVITIDDDILYPKDSIKVMVEDYEKNKDCIITLAANPILVDNEGNYCGYVLDNDFCIKQKCYSKYMSMGTLFPPHVFDGTDLFDYDKMMACTNGTHDELLFWVNSTIKGTMVIVENNYLENLEEYSSESNYSNGYKLWNINQNLDVLEWYLCRVREMYGEKLKHVLKNKIELKLDSDNLSTFFYEFRMLMYYRDNYVLNINDLQRGKVKTLRNFLFKNGINLDDVKCN